VIDSQKIHALRPPCPFPPTSVVAVRKDPSCPKMFAYFAVKNPCLFVQFVSKNPGFIRVQLAAPTCRVVARRRRKRSAGGSVVKNLCPSSRCGQKSAIRNNSRNSRITIVIINPFFIDYMSCQSTMSPCSMAVFFDITFDLSRRS
jgi:hypothetical protein